MQLNTMKIRHSISIYAILTLFILTKCVTTDLSTYKQKTFTYVSTSVI